eukprot:TRINITY_DN7615_c0_g1_i1.p1 TRINITY_DN7615_c0_g1~~TRINITY_DN7615_c0_g1_i1.p1  ORF type:complete len:613 (+),score=104.74 TRINITY_DN7615_c0_g1_i1:63-1901(+)
MFQEVKRRLRDAIPEPADASPSAGQASSFGPPQKTGSPRAAQPGIWRQSSAYGSIAPSPTMAMPIVGTDFRNPQQLAVHSHPLITSPEPASVHGVQLSLSESKGQLRCGSVAVNLCQKCSTNCAIFRHDEHEVSQTHTNRVAERDVQELYNKNAWLQGELDALARQLSALQEENSQRARLDEIFAQVKAAEAELQAQRLRAKEDDNERHVSDEQRRKELGALMAKVEAARLEVHKRDEELRARERKLDEMEFREGSGRDRAADDDAGVRFRELEAWALLLHNKECQIREAQLQLTRRQQELHEEQISAYADLEDRAKMLQARQEEVEQFQLRRERALNVDHLFTNGDVGVVSLQVLEQQLKAKSLELGQWEQTLLDRESEVAAKQKEVAVLISTANEQQRLAAVRERVIEEADSRSRALLESAQEREHELTAREKLLQQLIVDLTNRRQDVPPAIHLSAGEDPKPANPPPSPTTMAPSPVRMESTQERQRLRRERETVERDRAEIANRTAELQAREERFRKLQLQVQDDMATREQRMIQRARELEEDLSRKAQIADSEAQDSPAFRRRERGVQWFEAADELIGAKARGIPDRTQSTGRKPKRGSHVTNTTLF